MTFRGLYFVKATQKMTWASASVCLFLARALKNIKEKKNNKPNHQKHRLYKIEKGHASANRNVSEVGNFARI